MPYYKLSKEAQKVIKEKMHHGWDASKVVEWMVMEFSPSTLEEIVEQVNRRNGTRTEYLKKLKSTASLQTLKEVWLHGWKTGWVHFQIRKSKHPFRLEE